MSDYYNPANGECTQRDLERMANNVVDWVPQYAWSLERRIEAARKFGPNWASILNGCGDQ